MFNFKEVNHKSFKRNFLRTVIFQFRYEKTSYVEENSEKIKELFANIFPRQRNANESGFEVVFNSSQTPLVNQINQANGLEMKSDDGQKTLKINDNSFTLTVSGKVYTNFKSLMNDIASYSEFLNICKISSINRLAVRKINIIEFKRNNVSDNPSDMLDTLLNPDLIGNLNYFPNSEKITNNIQALNYKDGKNYLNIKYGLSMHPDTNLDIGQVVIDIDLFKQDIINQNEIDSWSSKINSEIFNIFNWAISDKTLGLLNDI